jgi:hypothetical protein
MEIQIVRIKNLRERCVLVVEKKTMLLVSLFLLFTQFSFSQKILDTAHYELNDPRNPNCPCHKFQKLADDEYKLVQKNNVQNSHIENELNFNQEKEIEKKELALQVKKDNGVQKQIAVVDTKNIGARTKKKKAGNWCRKKIYRSKLKHARIKKARPNYAVCYKW